MPRALISRLSNNAFIRGGVVFTSASFLVSVLHYIFNLLIARGFSLSDYGEYMSAFSYFAILSVPFSALHAIIINRIGRAETADRARVAMGIEQWVFGLLSQYKILLLCATLVAFGFFHFRTNLSTVSGLFILASVFLNLLLVLYSSILQAYKAFFVAGVFALSMAVVKVLLGATIAIYFSRLDMLYLLLLLLNMLTIFIGSKLIVFKQKIASNPPTFGTLQSYLFKKQVLLPTVTMFGIVGMLNMDVIFVKKFFDAEQAGLYAGLSLLGKIILYATGPLSLVALTFFSSSEHSQNSKKIVFYTFLLYVVVGFGITGLYYYFSEFVVRAVFGIKFIEISSLVWLTAIFGTLYSIVSLLGQYAISKHAYFGVLSVFGLGAQFLGLYFFHRTFYDALGVNIAVMLVMTTIYTVCILRDAK